MVAVVAYVKAACPKAVEAKTAGLTDTCCRPGGQSAVTRKAVGTTLQDGGANNAYTTSARERRSSPHLSDDSYERFVSSKVPPDTAVV